MLESIEIIKNAFLQYKGSGAYITLYLIALIYLFLKEDDKGKRVIFIYYPILTLIVLFNPIFNKLVGSIFKASLYSRVFWLIPLGITLAYATVKIIISEQNKTKRAIVLISIFITICVSGKFIYTNTNYVKVGNLYKLPDEHVLVAQLIGADKEENKKALVPETLCPHIRQIEPSIKLAYKRSPQGYEKNEYVLALNSGNTEQITNLAKENKCNYVVVKKEVILTVDFHYFGYEKLNETDNYIIYKEVKD